MDTYEQSKRRKIKYSSLSVETAHTGAYGNETAEQVVQTEHGSFEMPDNECFPNSVLSAQAAKASSSDVSSFPFTPKVLAIKIFFGNEYCIFRANSETLLKQVLAEASEFWNIPFSQFTLVDENDWVVSLWEKAETLLNSSKDTRTEFKEDRINNCSTAAEYIQLWLVEKDKKKRMSYQDGSNNMNVSLPPMRTSFITEGLGASKEVSKISPIFRFPTKGDFHFGKKQEFTSSQNETNENQNSPEVDSKQRNQTGEVAKLLVSLYPHNKNSELSERNVARTDATFSRNSLPRAAVDHFMQRYNVSPSLKAEVDSLFILEDEKTFCHICGQRDLKNPWLIRCKIADCATLYHPDCVRWIPFDATSCSIFVEEQLLRHVLSDLSVWKCPKHRCSECGDDTIPLASCTLCTISYCSKHVPPSVRPHQMSPYDWQENADKKSRKIICDVCLDKETKQDPPCSSIKKMEVEHYSPFPVCVMNLETILLPKIETQAIEFPWFATHFILKKHQETESITETDKVQMHTVQELEASSESTIGYSERTPKNMETSNVPSQKRPYIRRISPESLKRNDFDFLLNDGSVVKLGPLLNMKLTDDDVAAGLTNNRVLQAAFIILKDEKKPMDARELAERASERGFHCLSLMPNNTFSSQIYRNMKRKKEQSAFYKVNNGEFGLKIWLQTGNNANGEDGQDNKDTHEILSDEVQKP
ncbi:hypothetical protein GpartN1_g6181.t1 [Galdieria partita]|uniref:HTH HARE-type domain-containing protein n=1 Tax=Galdieria partita TaxID=83374 RepID=A0A9C7Q1M9_9RHOD|nr:hypothetical protein GpartN1_g6181.t1 [Galdieria partita]